MRMAKFSSGLYEGWVRHRRLLPKHHEFRYGLFMMYLDLDELPELFERQSWFSSRAWSPIRFKREDYLGPIELPLDVAVREAVERKIGIYPKGPIRMLTHPRYLGIVFNPVTFYYCFDETGQRVEAILAEITNTPWNERFQYVLREENDPVQRFCFEKDFHVSPFFPMDMTYQWHFTRPEDSLSVHMRNLQNNQRQFDVSLHLKRQEFTTKTLRSLVIRYPMMTVKVMWGIYYQAMRLWMKRIPFYTHPSKQKTMITEVHGEGIEYGS